MYKFRTLLQLTFLIRLFFFFQLHYFEVQKLPVESRRFALFLASEY